MKTHKICRLKANLSFKTASEKLWRRCDPSKKGKCQYLAKVPPFLLPHLNRSVLKISEHRKCEIAGHLGFFFFKLKLILPPKAAFPSIVDEPSSKEKSSFSALAVIFTNAFPLNCISMRRDILSIYSKLPS